MEWRKLRSPALWLEELGLKPHFITGLEHAKGVQITVEGPTLTVDVRTTNGLRRFKAGAEAWAEIDTKRG